MPAKRRGTPAHRAVEVIGWILAAVGIVGLIVAPDLLVLWVALIAFGVLYVPRSLFDRVRRRKR
jgi:hypothetical protein